MTAQALPPIIPTGVASAGFVLFGIPQDMLGAAFLGALLSLYFVDSVATARIPRLILGVCVFAFAAAWLAITLPRLHWAMTAWTIQVPPTALAGLLGMSLQTGIQMFGPAIARKLKRRVESIP